MTKESGKMSANVTSPLAAEPLAPRDYLKLIEAFPLMPIRSAAAYRHGLSIANELLRKKAAEGKLTGGATGYLTVLVDLLEAYEKRRFPRKRLSDGEILRHLLEAKNVTQVQVEAATGIAAPTLSAVIAGRRRLTRDQIGKLARYFGVAPTVFSFDRGAGLAS
jgi:HTH-type transcriptional regulator / antitoxin HigA